MHVFQAIQYCALSFGEGWGEVQCSIPLEG